MERVKRPDSDFKYRIVSGYGGYRLTWHTLECATGRNAHRSTRTALTPDERREAIKEKRGYEPYYRDHLARCCVGKKDHAANNAPTFTATQARKLFSEAREAGLRAGNWLKPNPMVVGSPTTLLGDDIDYSKETYYVADGVCGFAWVTIRPGNSSIARHAKKLGIGRTAYGGGVMIWIGDHNQSLERKTEHARAYAEALRNNGINASAESRID
mgnify:CR=1 FL=1|jgi:hypothetical protein|tara:strand:- start:716 stop:1354 length:639 start_codon:yes stop_codon:yes gene_type:complete